MSVLSGGMGNIKADELSSQEPVETVELVAEVIWAGIPEEMTIPNTTIKLMSGENVVESKEITDGSLEVKFTPVAKFNDVGEEILYSVSQVPLENFTTDIKDFVVENTYVEPVEEQNVEESAVEEPVVEEPVEEPKEEELVEEPKVEEPVEEPIEEPIENPIEQPVVQPTEEPVEEPIEETYANEVPQESLKAVVGADSVDIQADIGVMAVPVPPPDGYISDVGFDMIETDHDSINELTYVKYIWVQDGIVYMAITALDTIDFTTDGKLDVTINGTYPSGVTYYGESGISYQSYITIDGVDYSPIIKNDKAFWAVIYFEADNLPPLYDTDNVVYYNSRRGGGHDVVGETFNVVRTNYTFVVKKIWSDNHPLTLPPVTFNITFGGVTNVTTNPLTGTVDGTAEGIAEGESQGETEAWIYTWLKVPKTNAYGQDYTYTVTENTLDGYTTTGLVGPVKTNEGLTWTYEFTNTYNNNNVDVTAYKVWDGGPKPTVYFQLWQKIGTEESVVEGRLLEEITSTDLEANWEDLPEYFGPTTIIYFVKEVDENGDDYTPLNYEKSYSEDRLTVTNKYSSPIDDVSATKTWIGGPSEDWSGITLELYRTIDWNEGEPVNPEKIEVAPIITPRAGMANIWDYLWEDLEITDHDGNAYFYYVIEPIVPDNYDSVVDGLAVVNTYSSPLEDNVAKKIWENGNPLDHEAVELDLYRNIAGEEPVNLTELGLVGLPSVEPASGTSLVFVYTWSDLPVNDTNGNPYIYTVDEPDVPEGYEKSISADGLTVTNKAKTSSLQLLKTDDSELPVPLEGAEFELYRKVESTTVGAIAFEDDEGNPIYGVLVQPERLITDQNGLTQIIDDLEVGDYFVIEVVAPQGYMIHEYPIEFTIVATVTLNEFTIENEEAPMIPATGGMGTWLFTILGVGIMGGALLGFKKFNNKDNGKGENAMKNRKLFTFMFTLLVLFVFVAPSMAKAVETNSVALRTTDVTIHKMELFTPKDGLPADHDGTELDASELDALLGSGNYDGLPGVVFKYWKVPAGTLIGTLNGMTEEALDAAYDEFTLAATDVDGVITIPDMYDGFYYFREDYTPENVTLQIAVPFLLGLPVMNADGTAFITDLHIYPKNLTVRGAVELTKKAGTEIVPGAKFRLYKGLPTDNPRVEYDPEGPAVPIEYMTGADGKIFIDNLPAGSYYFVETFAPSPYLLNTTPIPFTIVKNETAEVVKVSLQNFEGPNISKSIVAPGTIAGSGDYHEPLDFFIDLMLPTDILTYSNLVVTDMISTKLDYKDSLVVKGSMDGTTWTTLVSGTHYNAVEPALDADGELKVTFIPAALKVDNTAFKYIRISFKAAINETAIMGQAIPNKAVITYDNGYLEEDISEDSNFVNAFTGGKNFIKVNGDKDALDGAEFAVKNAGGKFLMVDPVTGVYSWVDTLGATDFRLTSDANGLFSIKGLKYDLTDGTTYYLYETKAPMSTAGYPYNLIETDIPFLVNGSSYYTEPDAITSGTTLPTAVPQEVLNILGPQIPQTGGIGTALFTLIGGGLMGSAVILNKKRSRS